MSESEGLQLWGRRQKLDALPIDEGLADTGPSVCDESSTIGLKQAKVLIAQVSRRTRTWSLRDAYVSVRRAVKANSQIW